MAETEGGNQPAVEHVGDILRQMLRKHRLEASVVERQTGRKQQVVESLLHRQQEAELQKKLRRLHPADIAQALETLTPDERVAIWQELRRIRGGDILIETSEGVRKSLLESMDRASMLEVLVQLDADDLAYISDELPADVLETALERLSETERDWLQSARSYPQDSVGQLMSPDFVAVSETATLQDAQTLMRSLKDLPDHTDKLFVTDRRGVLTGVLSLQSILVNEGDKLVKSVMATKVVTFNGEDELDEAAQAFERYDLISAPVIDERGKLVGRLTFDEVMDYIREESHEDVLNIAGVKGEEDLFSSVWTSARNRGSWLVINLFTAFIASRVIGAFEATLTQLVALAALMPIVASVGGNTGNQTVALVIRGLATGQVSHATMGRLLRKEFAVAIVNGIGLGLVVAIFTMAFYQDAALAAVIAAAMVITLILAAVVGMAIPIVLDKLDRDPALGSSILLTATTDSLGFFIFLSFATLILF